MDPNQRLCLGALFDIAATNVSYIYSCNVIHFLRLLALRLMGFDFVILGP